MKIKNVVVAGGGVLGSQIAFQAAYCGFDVTIWLRSEGSIGRTQPKLDSLKQTYIDTIEKMATPEGQTPNVWARGIADYETFNKEACLEKAEKAYAGLKLELDMKKAVENADLVIESMAENAEEKISFYKRLAPLLPEKTVIVTNSSTLLPSKFAKYTGRPEKFLSLHFANSIWKNNTAEIMSQSKTDKLYFDQIMDFAKDIRMIALPVLKEKSGYLLNSCPFSFRAWIFTLTAFPTPKASTRPGRWARARPKGLFRSSIPSALPRLTTSFRCTSKSLLSSRLIISKVWKKC